MLVFEPVFVWQDWYVSGSVLESSLFLPSQCFSSCSGCLCARRQTSIFLKPEAGCELRFPSLVFVFVGHDLALRSCECKRNLKLQESRPWIYC